MAIQRDVQLNAARLAVPGSRPDGPLPTYPSFFCLFIRQSRVRPLSGSGIVATPRCPVV